MQDEDVTKLTDEELDAKLNGEQAEETEEEATEESAEAQTSEDETEEEQTEKTTEEEEPEPQPEEVTKEESPTEEPPKLSRRQELAIQKILGQRQPRTNPQPSQPVRQDALDYEKELDADPEVIKRLDADRQASQQSGYNQGLEQAKSIQFHTRLEVDAPKVEAKYDFLDKSSANFDPVRANAMNSLYLDSVGYDPGDAQQGIPESVTNPNIRYADFVEAQMEFAEALMSDRQAQTVKNVAKQAAQTGLRPDGSSAKPLNLNKAPQDMTDEELDAILTRSGYGTRKRQ